MKPHRTFTITKRMLKAEGVCSEGMRAVAHLLPAKLSTDPEKNLKIACALADSNYARGGGDAGYWLRNAFVFDYVMPSSLLAAESQYYTQRDAWITAQWLAWVADALLSRTGR